MDASTARDIIERIMIDGGLPADQVSTEIAFAVGFINAIASARDDRLAKATQTSAA